MTVFLWPGLLKRDNKYNDTSHLFIPQGKVFECGRSSKADYVCLLTKSKPFGRRLEPVEGHAAHSRRHHNHPSLREGRRPTKRKLKATTNSKHTYPVLPDLLNQNFTAQSMNQIWTSDITYIRTKAGWLYLTVIMDLFNRQIIGWSMSDR